MEKSKSYKSAYFSTDLVRSVISSKINEKDSKNSFRLRRADESWEFDDENEFFAEYRRPHLSSTIRKSGKEVSISINYTHDADTTIIVQGKTRGEIESVFEKFEENYESSIISIIEQETRPIVFIGHGRSPLWRELKDHLTDKHDYKIEAYETGARAGHTIRDVLDDMASKSSFAILVMTGEDESVDGKIMARPNVIHEIGLFQGRLGFNKAIVLLEKETDEFSNLSGIQQLRFSKGNIKETFGDVLATLKREFENKKNK